MPQLPIRSIIARAVEKRDEIDNFIALPVLFEKEYDWQAEPHVQSEVFSQQLGEAKMLGLWHTPNSIEIVLDNGLRVSIQTNPLTLAMKIVPASEAVDEIVPITLIRHDEDAVSTAALVESRIRSVRQIYAIGVIALSGTASRGGLEHADLSHDLDYEAFLPEDERLVILAAGQGTFWMTVKVGSKAVWKFAKGAPKMSYLAVTTLLKGGQKRAIDYADALVKEKKGIAAQAEAAGRNAMAGAETAEAIAKAVVGEAEKRAQLETEKLAHEAAKQKLDNLMQITKWVEDMKDPEIKEGLKAKLLADLNTHSTLLLGPPSLPPEPKS